MGLATWLQELNETKSRLERAQGAAEDFQRRFLQVGAGPCRGKSLWGVGSMLLCMAWAWLPHV